MTLLSRDTDVGVVPVGIEVELEFEDLAAADVARSRGWQSAEAV